LQAFLPNFTFLGHGVWGNLYRFGTDLLTIAVFMGLIFLLVRRFVVHPMEMQTRKNVLLHPKARFGIQRDSAIVGAFILLHVGGRFIGETFHLARSGGFDVWQPFASTVAGLWRGLPSHDLMLGEHVAFWFALGLILGFLPYFPYTKHIHIFFAPMNFTLKPQRRSIGELSALNFEDESIEQFGATRLEHLGWEQIMDAYACIMCFRCQQVCPAYTTGKALSPAALEINKRYFLNYEGKPIVAGRESSQTLTEFAISVEAVWACTACGACIDICPVGNEPMRDILDIRRALVLMENSFPEQFKSAYRGMERTQNPWNVPPTERMQWADGLQVPRVEENPDMEILWWVGCAPATDMRARKIAQAFAKILNHAGVKYAVLGEQERCTGDAARRSGKEDLFYELALGNIEVLNEIAPKRIVTTCPHCLHTLKNEYPAYGGEYHVIHHTQYIWELFEQGKIEINHQQGKKVVFHDPCYLGRMNDVVKEPRKIISQLGLKLLEMPHHAEQSFCCGAGGAQMWKEESEGSERVSECRFNEASAVSADMLAVGCPFCLTMFNDAAKDLSKALPVMDLCEIIADMLKDNKE